MLKVGLFLLVAFVAGTQVKKSERLAQILKDNPDYLTNAPRPSPQVNSAQSALAPQLQSTLMVNEVAKGPALPGKPKGPPAVVKPLAKEIPKPVSNANAPSPAPRPTYAPQCEDYHNICNYHGIYSCCPGQKGLKARCDHKDCDPKRPLGTSCGGEWMAVMCPKTCALCRVPPGGGPDGSGCATPPCPVQQPPIAAAAPQPAQPCLNAPNGPQPAPGAPCANGTGNAAGGGAAGPNSAAVKLAEQIKAVARASVAAEQAREAAKTAKSAVEVVKQA